MSDDDDNDDDEKDDNQNKRSFDAVKLYIERVIFGENKVVSMKCLQTIFGDKSESKSNRHYLKQRIIKEFPNRLQFVQPSSNISEVVFSTSLDTILPGFNENSNIISLAKQLRQDIISYCDSVPSHKWPPTFESLTAEYGNPPESIKLFLKHLLTAEKNPNQKRTCRLIDSITSDLIHNIGHGKVITPKHYLVALGLHNLTGQRQPVVITNKFGHCMSYDRCCEIESALSEASIARSKETNILPIAPNGPAEVVLTVFWVDNFDVKVEKAEGGGAVNTTHLMAFQEQEHHSLQDQHVPVQKSKKRKLSALQDEDEQIAFLVDTVAEPPFQANNKNFVYDNEAFQQLQFLWLYLRKCNHFDQVVPTFSGWKHFGNKSTEKIEIRKTVETYLPPITSKVTEFTTISKYMTYLQSLAASSNMPYVNITLDVGAAINAYKFLWSNQQLFSNVMIHLGDFHFMKENFQVRIFIL